MALNPPAGSNISVVNETGDPRIVVPQAGGVSRYFGGLFLLFWLGGWAMGFKSVGSLLLAGKANAFLLFWFGGWTLAGIFAVVMAYRSLRPSVSETLELRRSSVAYDSGIAPPQFGVYSRYQTQRDAWKQIFAKRIRVELDRGRLQSLRLRETDAGNRLTIDLDAQRLELARGASEVEREWLARLLASRYALTQVFGKAGA